MILFFFSFYFLIKLTLSFICANYWLFIHFRQWHQRYQCPICFEHYNDQSKCPRLLSCGHSFCSSCLERLLHGNTIDCPTCRNPGAVPTGVEGLLKNFALLDIVNDTPKENVNLLLHAAKVRIQFIFFTLIFFSKTETLFGYFQRNQSHHNCY